MSHTLERRLARLEQQRSGNGVMIISLRNWPVDLDQAERQANANGQILVIIDNFGGSHDGQTSVHTT
jgi:hypothetical protein